MSVVKRWRKSFYMPGVDQRWYMDLSKRIICRRVPRFPRMVQIQTRTGCNGACVFCPYPDASEKVPKGKMDEGLLEKIVAEIARYNVTRRISPYLMNEPFLDKSILERARFIKRHVPRASIVLTTNGSLLTDETLLDLVKDNPLRALYISMQGIEKEPYEDSMRGSLKFERTKANIERLIELRDQYAPELKIVVTMIKTKLVDVDKAVAYWRSRGVESKYTRLENRGGNTDAFDTLNVGDKRIYKDCVRLLKNAYILFNGDMILCCTDYYKTMVLGNVAESSIAEVWNSERATTIRRDFLRGDLSRIPLCADCYIAEID
ncbi:MAG TPA: radical SAM protein [Candidatus Hydrogenedentes bacterium]|nr:radical SAM protein [Candidatus Hydrogenedentota bacterium]